jgi:hypothetical protein
MRRLLLQWPVTRLNRIGVKSPVASALTVRQTAGGTTRFMGAAYLCNLVAVTKRLAANRESSAVAVAGTPSYG